MIRLIDTNALSYLLENRLILTQKYYLAPEVESEAQITQNIFNEQLTSNYLSINTYEYFNEARYFHHFKEMLNKHNGFSFFNMTGMGDISILASLHTVLEVYDSEARESLFPPERKIYVYTEDLGLRKKIPREFKEEAIILFNYSDLN